MKLCLLILSVFALALGALHAQIPTDIPGVDPAIQAAVNAAVPAHWSGYTSLAILALMILGRWIKAVQNGTGIKGWFSAIWSGTNTPHILIACLALLSLTSCSTMKKWGAALSTPQAVQIEASLLNLGILEAKLAGKIAPGDAIAISNGVAIITSPGSTVSKIVPLAQLIDDEAVAHKILTPGTGLIIKDATAIIVKAATPATPAPTVTPVPATATPAS